MTKDDVLAILINSNGYVSGESISAAIGVSRAAVNGAVKSLKADGCVIDSVTNKGYKLTYCPDRLFAGEVYSYLDGERRKSVICLPSVDSTNNRLKDMLKSDIPSGTCIIANEQTAGRGRIGRSFISPANTGIYLSMLIRPKGTIEDLSEITCWTAVAVHNAILSTCSVNTDIKWVNDLYINNRKITGILTELSIEGEIGLATNVIVGIGVNVNQKSSDFPDELKDIATSIAAETDSEGYNRAKIAAGIIRELDKMNDNWHEAKDEYLKIYRDNCLTIGKDVSVINYATGISRPGHAVDVNEDFTLKVRFDDGSTEDVRSGEVSVKWEAKQ